MTEVTSARWACNPVSKAINEGEDTCPQEALGIINAVGRSTFNGISQTSVVGHFLKVKASWMNKLVPLQREHDFIAP